MKVSVGRLCFSFKLQIAESTSEMGVILMLAGKRQLFLVAIISLVTFVSVLPSVAYADGHDYELDFTDGAGSFARSHPDLSSTVGITPVAEGAVIHVECWTTGDYVMNSLGYVSNLWFRDASRQFWPEVLVNTGRNGVPAGVANCDTGIVTSEPPSAPLPSCYGDSCTDLDPNRTTCAADARTIWSKRDSYGVLEMRYSPSCFSNWVRYSPWGGVRATIADILAKGIVTGDPWIWRDGVSNVPRGSSLGMISDADAFTPQIKWTAMITADGRTCMSVDIYEFSTTGPSGTGGTKMSRDKLDGYSAGCIG